MPRDVLYRYRIIYKSGVAVGGRGFSRFDCRFGRVIFIGAGGNWSFGRVIHFSRLLGVKGMVLSLGQGLPNEGERENLVIIIIGKYTYLCFKTILKTNLNFFFFFRPFRSCYSLNDCGYKMIAIAEKKDSL